MSNKKSTHKPSTSRSKRRTFTDEFKAEAVKLVTEQGYKVAEAARSLGINANLIHRWKEQLAEPDNDSDSEELKKLRAENKRLRMERDILKKATAFFANEKN